MSWQAPKPVAIGVYVFALLMILVGTALGGTFVGSQTGAQSGDGLIAGGGCGALDDPTTVSAGGADSYFKGKKSPLEGTGGDLVAAAQEFGVNPALMIGIANAESSLGKNGRAVTNKNPGNIKTLPSTLAEAGIPSLGRDDEGHTIFPDWPSGWRGLAHLLRTFYFSEERDTVEKIAQKYLEGDKAQWAITVNQTMEDVCEKKEEPITGVGCGKLADPIRQGKLSLKNDNDRAGLPKGQIVRVTKEGEGELVTVNSSLCDSLASMLNSGLSIPSVTQIVGTHRQFSSDSIESFHWSGRAMDIAASKSDEAAKRVMLYLFENRKAFGINELFSPWHDEGYNIDRCTPTPKNVPGHDNHIHAGFGC